MITNIVKILAVVSKDGSVSFYSDTDLSDHPMSPEVRIYQQDFDSAIMRRGYIHPTYAPQTFRECE